MDKMTQGLRGSGLEGGEEKRVLLCISQGTYSETIIETLLHEGYEVFLASIPNDALKQLQIGRFQVVIIEESFIKDEDSLSTYLEDLPMSSRREIIYVLIGKGLRTANPMDAYTQGVDLVVDIEDVNSLGRLLNETIEDHERSYKTFKDILQGIGG